MQSLNISTGVKEYTLKGEDTGEIVIRFNPTDIFFAEKLYNAFTMLDNKQSEYTNITGMDNKEAFSFCRKVDQEMRNIIDEIFGVPASNAVFGELHSYSMAGGLPVWMNLEFAVMDEMQDAFTREKKATDPRLKKYIDRYKR